MQVLPAFDPPPPASTLESSNPRRSSEPRQQQQQQQHQQQQQQQQHQQQQQQQQEVGRAVKADSNAPGGRGELFSYFSSPGVGTANAGVEEAHSARSPRATASASYSSGGDGGQKVGVQ